MQRPCGVCLLGADPPALPHTPHLLLQVELRWPTPLPAILQISALNVLRHHACGECEEGHTLIAPHEDIPLPNSTYGNPSVSGPCVGRERPRHAGRLLYADGTALGTTQLMWACIWLVSCAFWNLLVRGPWGWSLGRSWIQAGVGSGEGAPPAPGGSPQGSPPALPADQMDTAGPSDPVSPRSCACVSCHDGVHRLCGHRGSTSRALSLGTNLCPVGTPGSTVVRGAPSPRWNTWGTCPQMPPALSWVGPDALHGIPISKTPHPPHPTRGAQTLVEGS